MAALMGVALVSATACLGPTDVDPTGHAPIGSLDVLAGNGDGIRVAGWVLDPDTSAPIGLRIIQNQVGTDVTADIPRGDVAAAHPGYGPNHGFDFTIPNLAPGRHQVCVLVKGVGPGEGRSLGCGYATVGENNPFGALESVSAVGPGLVRAAGWAIDPSTPASINVNVLMDGGLVTTQLASRPRGDVAAAYGQGGNRGYSIDFQAPPGQHTFCSIAHNVGNGAPQWLGCQTIVVPNPVPDRRPAGSVTSVEPSGADAVRVRGTATDPDSADPVTVRIVVDGGAPTVVQALGGSYDSTITGLGPGHHDVCVTAADVIAPGGNDAGDMAWPCGAVVLGSVAVGTSGAPSGSTPVGPTAGTPLAKIDRDAGISVTLSDSSVLWLFGDSLERTTNGSTRYFVNNTAAWAAAGSPTVTRDAVAAGNVPYQFVKPAAAFATACPTGWSAVMWPIVGRPDHRRLGGPRARLLQQHLRRTEHG